MFIHVARWMEEGIFSGKPGAIARLDALKTASFTLKSKARLSSTSEAGARWLGQNQIGFQRSNRAGFVSEPAFRIGKEVGLL